MNKKILAKLASITAGVALLAGATFAAFTSNSVTISNVNLTTATPTLQIWNGSSYQPTANGETLGIVETNMYPSWVGSNHSILMKNITGGSVPFGAVFANLSSAGGSSWDALKNVVQMRFTDVTSPYTTSWYTLLQWNADAADILGSTDFADGTQRQFNVQFQMLSSAGDAAKGKTLNFTLSFAGQTP